MRYVVFLGATAALSDELLKMAKSSPGTTVIAPAMPRSQLGDMVAALDRCIPELIAKVAGLTHRQSLDRLSVWAYHLSDELQRNQLWRVFGSSAWIEYVPAELRHKDQKTRAFVEQRLLDTSEHAHQISFLIQSKRKTSPFPLPLLNFESEIVSTLSQNWYAGLSEADLRTKTDEMCVQFRRRHSVKGPAHRDDRGLYFAPAEDGACHGVAHPTGTGRCYLSGKFRFGASLFAGFHYDVRPERGLLQSVLVGCDGANRELARERREYINVFPNDHMLPEKKQGA